MAAIRMEIESLDEGVQPIASNRLGCIRDGKTPSRRSLAFQRASDDTMR